MDNRCVKLLSSIKSGTGSGYPIILVNENNRQANIQIDKISDFWLQYCDIVSDFNSNPGLAELPGNVCPIIIEGTFRFKQSAVVEDIIPQQVIYKIIMAYWEILDQTFKIAEIKDDEEIISPELDCAFLLTPEYTVKNERCATFRLQFPFCQTDPNIHLNVIRPQVINYLMDNHTLGIFECQPLGDWDVFLNPKSITSPVTLYGSSKNDIPKLEFQRIYRRVTLGDDVRLETFHEIDGLFNPEKHLHVMNSEIPKKIIHSHENNFWMPLVFSLTYYTKSAKLKNDVEEIPKITLLSDAPDDNPLVIAEKLLPLLSSKRATNVIFWNEIGRILYRSSGGGDNGLVLWKHFTFNHGGDISKCDEAYIKFENEVIKVTIKTIAFYARIDNPIEYEKWHDEWCSTAFRRCTKYLTDHNVAVAFYRCYWIDYVCHGESKKHWFKFIGHTWKHIKDALEISVLISNDFAKKMDKFAYELSGKKLANEDPEERNLMNKELLKSYGLAEKLGNHKYKDTLIKECAKEFNNDEFTEYNNLNYMILPFRNCVLEADDENGCILIREGKPEDYMTWDTKINYPRQLTKNSPLVKNYDLWLEQLFPNPELRKEFRKLLSSLLRGKNIDKKVPVLTGTTNGGKSSLVACICLALGPFAMKFDENIASNRKQSGAANPGLARTMHARVCFYEEADKSDVIPARVLKKLSGGDKIYARGNYKDGEDFDILYKFVIVANKVPIIKDADPALKDRFYPIPFTTKYVDKSEAPQDKEEQKRLRIYPREPLFEKKYPEMAQAMIWSMVQDYPIYAKEKLQKIDDIKAAAEEHWGENDQYQLFINEFFTPSKDPHASVNEEDAFTTFREWCKEKFNYTPTWNIFHVEMVERLGKPEKKRWKKYILENKDEMEERKKRK